MVMSLGEKENAQFKLGEKNPAIMVWVTIFLKHYSAL